MHGWWWWGGVVFVFLLAHLIHLEMIFVYAAAAAWVWLPPPPGSTKQVYQRVPGPPPSMSSHAPQKAYMHINAHYCHNQLPKRLWLWQQSARQTKTNVGRAPERAPASLCSLQTSEPDPLWRCRGLHRLCPLCEAFNRLQVPSAVQRSLVYHQSYVLKNLPIDGIHEVGFQMFWGRQLLTTQRHTQTFFYITL